MQINSCAYVTSIHPGKCVTKFTSISPEHHIVTIRKISAVWQPLAWLSA